MYEVVSEYFHTFTLLAGAIVDCVCLVTGSFMPSTFPSLSSCLWASVTEEGEEGREGKTDLDKESE